MACSAFRQSEDSRRHRSSKSGMCCSRTTRRGWSGVFAASPTFVSLISSLVTGKYRCRRAGDSQSVYCSDNTITRNMTGLSLITGGTGQTALDNAVANNTASAALTSVVPEL
jgi:hypothetical protein